MIQPWMSAWPENIRKHLLGECRKCLAVIADDPQYGRKVGKVNSTLCECCDWDLNGIYGGNNDLCEGDV